MSPTCLFTSFSNHLPVLFGFIGSLTTSFSCHLPFFISLAYRLFVLPIPFLPPLCLPLYFTLFTRSNANFSFPPLFCILPTFFPFTSFLFFLSSIFHPPVTTSSALTIALPVFYNITLQDPHTFHHLPIPTSFTFSAFYFFHFFHFLPLSRFPLSTSSTFSTFYLSHFFQSSATIFSLTRQLPFLSVCLSVCLSVESTPRRCSLLHFFDRPSPYCP